MSSPISKSRWQQIRPVLSELLELAEAEQLPALARWPDLDDGLRAEIRKLLEAERTSLDFLEAPAFDLIAPEGAPRAPKPSTASGEPKINRYKILGEIGRGGMGTVYLAESQATDFTHTVAIKVLANERSDHQLIERFRREQQTLAKLSHPNIARIFDGGTTDEGRAYYVMEYVEGEPIDAYCEANALDVHGRLRLIGQVALAVHFAHQRFIVHRDLKPSNILIKTDGTVKLLDFGIAKLLDLDEQMKLTHDDSQPLTPGFAAPEQLLNRDITIATDVYQLGVITYTLLTGTPPHSDADKSFAQLVHDICNQDPPPPSARVRDDGHRWRTLKGDIDAIVLKMLRGDASERYSSMEALQQDISAYFRHRPVQARQWSIGYQSKKYLRRHWRPLSAVAVVIGLTISYAITATYQARTIRAALETSQRERDKAQRVSDLLVSVFNAADPNVTGLEGISAKQLLMDGERRIVDELQNVPEIRSYMINTLAEIWQRQGDFKQMRSLLSRALEQARQSHEPASAERGKSMALLGIAFYSTGEFAAAMEMTDSAIDTTLSLLDHRDPTTTESYAYALLAHGIVLNAMGDIDEGESFVKQAVTLLETAARPNSGYLAKGYLQLALMQHMRGSFTQAKHHMKLAMRHQAAVTGKTHFNYSRLLLNMAVMYRDTEEFARAESFARKALAIQTTVLGEADPSHAIGLRLLGVIQHRQGHLQEAEALLADAAGLQQSDAVAQPDQVLTNIRQAELLLDLDRFQEVVDLLQSPIGQLEQQTDSGDLLGRVYTLMARANAGLGQWQTADAQFTRALALMSDSSLLKSTTQLAYAGFLLNRNELDEGLKLAGQAFAKRQQNFNPEHSWYLEAEAVWGSALALNGRTAEALPLLQHSLEHLPNQPLVHFGRLRPVHQQAQTLFTAMGGQSTGQSP